MPARQNTDLLRSYASGPKIWDATALMPEVATLADAGLIEPVPGSAAYRLTDAGRAELEARGDSPAWTSVPELFELVTWADIAEGDHVWSMGGVCLITRGQFRNNDSYDCDLRPGIMRFGHRSESGSEFAPPMDLLHRVPRLIPPRKIQDELARRITKTPGQEG